jgi:hypothetical protein
MYRGKSIQTPQTLFEICRGGWLSTVLHLWTRGVALPVFELRLTGLPGVLGTWEDYHHPVARVEDSISDAPPPLSDGGEIPAAVMDHSSGMVYTFCGEVWGGLPTPEPPHLFSGDDVLCDSPDPWGFPCNFNTPVVRGRLRSLRKGRGAREEPVLTVRPSRRDLKGEPSRSNRVTEDATLSHPLTRRQKARALALAKDRHRSRSEGQVRLFPPAT